MAAQGKQKRGKYLHSVFALDPLRPSNYVATGGDKLPFSWFRISEAKSQFLINQGAHRIAESYKDGEKVLFTGMRRVGNTMWWEGNRYDKGKKSLLLFRYHVAGRCFDVYLFRNYYPSAEAKRENFIQLFIYNRKKEISETHAPDISNVQSNAVIPAVCIGKDNTNS